MLNSAIARFQPSLTLRTRRKWSRQNRAGGADRPSKASLCVAGGASGVFADHSGAALSFRFAT
jgi:hypothetical protein